MQRPPHIGLNLLNQVPHEAGGIETYARELTAALIEKSPQMRFTAFMNAALYEAQGDEPWPEGLNTVRIPIDPAHRVRRVLAEQVLLPRHARRGGVDLLHSLGTVAPVRVAVPHVVTIHDLTWVRLPEALPRLGTLSLNFLMPRIARRADWIITDSLAAKNEITAHLATDAARVSVVHLGFGRSPGCAGTPEAQLRKKLGLGSVPIVLHVSGKRENKNLIRLVDSFANLKHEPRPVLVLPGPADEPYERKLSERAKELGLKERVKLLGWLDQPDLEGLFSAATCFVFPSLIEGFGLPVLEAMHRGLPVALSNAPPLPEVGGDAARYFDPYDVQDIAGAIEELLTDAEMRSCLIAAGKERAKEFTWERTADQTLAVYERVLQER